MQHLTANEPNSTLVYGWDVWDGLSSISRESPKGVKLSSRSVDVTRGNLAWKFERQFVRTDVVFISVCLSRRTARLLDLSTAASVSGAHVHSRAEHVPTLYRSVSHVHCRGAPGNLSGTFYADTWSVWLGKSEEKLKAATPPMMMIAGLNPRLSSIHVNKHVAELPRRL